VALKGCGTIIATVDGDWWVNSTGNPGMATAGMGDVLTGMITALLAQGWPAVPALLAAVHLHGAAADRLVADGNGPIGLTAGEVSDAARQIFNEWVGTGKAY
jgi:NAD(P)H-hydrate repair Nnr-like enzyme with NAD(P)H-hydrate dehydratase domain